MPLKVNARLEINRAIENVSAYVFEPLNDPVWIGGIKEAQLLTERPIGKGSRVHRLAKFMGKTIDYILEVTVFEPNRLLKMKSVKSPFPMEVTYCFENNNHGGTFVQINVEGTSKNFFKIADFLIAPMIQRNLKKDLERLKNICEK